MISALHAGNRKPDRQWREIAEKLSIDYVLIMSTAAQMKDV